VRYAVKNIPAMLIARSGQFGELRSEASVMFWVCCLFLDFDFLPMWLNSRRIVTVHEPHPIIWRFFGKAPAPVKETT